MHANRLHARGGNHAQQTCFLLNSPLRPNALRTLFLGLSIYANIPSSFQHFQLPTPTNYLVGNPQPSRRPTSPTLLPCPSEKYGPITQIKFG
ncbi:hypothetical protein CUMW_118990 [Citrus unshiu]|nr:hypothetical protein CUMW_118990 [Citrus unshiu]